jgi:hypothetical protein
VCEPVLWTRIQIFWLDPNPKKNSDSDSGTVVKYNFLLKIADQTLEREEKLLLFNPFIHKKKIIYRALPRVAGKKIAKKNPFGHQPSICWWHTGSHILYTAHRLQRHDKKIKEENTTNKKKSPFSYKFVNI